MDRGQTRAVMDTIALQNARHRPRAASYAAVDLGASVAAIATMNHRDRFLIHPEEHRWLGTWDATSMVALLFTSIVTPYEVGFVPETSVGNVMFWINRLVDLFFLSDMLLNFFSHVPR
mmetsp:Transcript_4081/g.8680  ORF Transcript_4081/g.8680 Transcript_4081/m.8680 type:complete len:118 (-) Transcript_4081:1485-1838(-)